MGLVPGGRISKQTVRYRPHEKCAYCDHFFSSGACEFVEGTIAPDAICDKFEIKSVSNVGKDAAFYMAEYEKGKDK